MVKLILNAFHIVEFYKKLLICFNLYLSGTVLMSTLHADLLVFLCASQA